MTTSTSKPKFNLGQILATPSRRDTGRDGAGHNTTQEQAMTFPTFTPTQWDTAQDKATFAKQFMRFVQSDFDAKQFTDKFYRRLSNTFGHIAHYDRGGFWAEFFTSTADKVRFLEQTLQYPCYGDPAWTYCDVERALQAWLKADGTLDRYRQRLAEETETAERAELARLQQKYA